MTEYPDRKPPFNFANPHIAWLACLGCLLRRVRCEGWMSIEGAVETPRDAGHVFELFPQVLETPYLGFATDVLRMMVAGNLAPDDMQVYAEHAMDSLTAADASAAGGKVDASLLNTIWLTMWAGMKGYTPQVAVEFGRQAVPVGAKPQHGELEEIFRTVRDAWRNDPREARSLDERIGLFIESFE